MAEQLDMHPPISKGMKPYDFVQQVYYMQEKVILEFDPTDDKYREVLFEANLILQELQNIEDWTWLREKLILGPCHSVPGTIPEWKLPDWVYKVSTLNHDSIKLMKPIGMHHESFGLPGRFIPYSGMWLDTKNYIDVPLASSGDNQYRKERVVTGYGAVHFPEEPFPAGQLRAIRMGDTITFNRPLTPFEQHFIATIDVQRKIPLIHVCDETCTTADGDRNFDYSITETHDFVKPCSKIEDRILVDIPDPNYLVMATAARHAEGSPPALARVAGLQDNAQRIMSQMRQNDSAATDSDWQDWETPGYMSVY